MKRPVTSLCRRPGKKPPAGQPVPDTGTISAHRDALRRASGTAGQKPPGRGRKNSPGEGQELCTGCAHGGAAGNGGVWWLKVTSLGARRGRGHARAQKQPRAEAGSCAQTAPMGEGRQWEVSGAGKAPHWAHAGAEGTPGRKNSPRRGPEAVWMRDMGVTCPGRSV